MNAWDIFYKNIISQNLVKDGDKVLLGVSGGADSMCMLHLFWRLAKKINIKILAVNLNHGLRKESVKEAKLVADVCKKFKIACALGEIAVKQRAKDLKISIETAARQLRYAAFEKIANEQKFNKVATAHNANDNAETVLMWLIRGSGNFEGIPQTRKLSKKVEVVRPLLAVERNLIDKYVKTQKIPFCTDKSNFSFEYTRNKIRHSVVPALEKINPAVIERIFSLSKIQERENAYLEEISIKFAKKCVKTAKNRILLDLPMFLRYNEALKYRILKSIMPAQKYAVQIDAVMQKILLSDKTPLKLTGGWVFTIKNKKAVFENKAH